MIAVALFAAAAGWAQDTGSGATHNGGRDVCTDLSRTVVVPCPGEKSASAAPAKPATVPSSGEPSEPATVSGEKATPAAATRVQPAAATQSIDATAIPEEPVQVPGGVSASRETAQPAAATRVQPVTATQPIDATAIPEEPVPAAAAAGSTLTLTAKPPSLVRNFAGNVLYDQTRFWTSPLRFRLSDAYWGIPFGIATGGLLAADTSIEKELPSNPDTIRRAKDFSNYGAFAFAGATGGAFLWGSLTHRDHLRETGLLAGEAAANSLLATEAIKYAAGRQRPLEGNGRGNFFSGGQSFTSEHAAEAWSVATVFAHQYPGPLTQFLAYGGAAAVSAGRVIGRQHFSADVFVGSALGWYFAEQAIRRHAKEQEADRKWGTFLRAPEPDVEEARRHEPGYLASPYVPLDSWVYSAFDRLIALGYAPTAFEDMRPWTRLECARLTQEVGQALQGPAGELRNDEAAKTFEALSSEFAPELRTLSGAPHRGIGVDSVYTRAMAISGPVLNSGLDFGQSIIDDYGRPDREGTNIVTGFSASASADMFTGYFRGEFQHSPSAAALPDAARAAAGAADGLPPAPGVGFDAINRLQILEAYAGVSLGGWQLTFGRQSLWWGPSGGSPMLFSDNARPITMLRLSRTSPFKLPGVMGLLGPVRLEYFLGQLDGQNFLFGVDTGLQGQYGVNINPQPFINGTRASFHFSPNLEFGVSFTKLFAGKGVPFTAHTFFNSMFGTANGLPGGPNDPGDRRSGVDFSYRLPGMRKWLTFYADGFADDQFSPIAYADRSAWRAGLYAPRVPGIPKLDFRVEGVYTDLPIGGNVGHGFFYFNGRYLNGYTSDGNLLGNWIGRQGQGAQSWATYHLTPKSFVQATFRHQKVSQQFLSGGGTLSDFGVNTSVWLNSNISVAGGVQYERWNFPIIAAQPQSNVATTVQVTFWPKLALKQK